MTRTKRPKFGWEVDDDDPHSIEGIGDIKNKLKHGLTKLYTGIAESMWKWEGFEHEKLRDTLYMSRGTCPEKGLHTNGELVAFEYGDQIYILPFVPKKELNLYGFMDRWSPMPYGWSINDHKEAPDAWNKIMQLELDSSNSVILRNDLFGSGDAAFVEKMVDMLVDVLLDVNQLALLASNPIVFNVTEENLVTAKSVYLKMANHCPVIYKNLNGEKAIPQTENLNVKIDPSLFEILDRWECELLTYLGFPCVPITKRAQQSVSEVQSNDDKVQVRRMEKLRQRETACERINELFGTSLSVTCVIDEMQEEQMRKAEQEQEKMYGGGKNVQKDS